MSGTIPRIALNNGNSIPVVGLGTWKSKPGVVTQAVKDAIDCGYNHIDCAHVYGNEQEVGEAIKAKISDGTIKREDLFITSKLWCTFHSKDLVLPILKESLKNLGVDYLDLYLIHWPMGFKEKGGLFPVDENKKILYSDVDYMESWSALEECVAKSLVKSIGASNFNSEQLERVCKMGNIKPAVNQVECHPNLNQKKLIDFCKSKGIVVTAYSPLGSPDRPWAKPEDPVLLEDPVLVKIAEKHNKTTAQIMIKYQTQRGVVCIPKSVTKSRIESNLKVFDFDLSEEDMATIDSLDCGGRVCQVDWYNDHPLYPFHIEF